MVRYIDQRRRLPVVIPGIMMFASAVHSQSLIQQIGWRVADPLAVTGVLSFMIAWIGILVGLHTRRKKNNQALEREAAGELYQSSVERLKLTETEAAKIPVLLRHETVIHPHTIFQSFQLFERCVDAEVRKILSEYPSDDDRRIEEDLLSSLRRKMGYSYLPLEHPLLSTRNIAIGQVCSVFGSDHRLPMVHRATVVNNQEFCFTVQFDPQREDVPRITPGTRLKLAFARQNDGVYGIILDVLSFDKAGVFEFGHTLEMRRNQLRQYVRVEANLPLRFRMIKPSDPESNDIGKQDVIECKMIDISGGGLSFLCDRSLRPGDVVSLTFALPASSLSGVAGKVIRVGLQEGRSALHYRHHVQFVGIDPARREQIVKYVFERQRQINQWR